jgi:hypothetical protein
MALAAQRVSHPGVRRVHPESDSTGLQPAGRPCHSYRWPHPGHLSWGRRWSPPWPGRADAYTSGAGADGHTLHTPQRCQSWPIIAHWHGRTMRPQGLFHQAQNGDRLRVSSASLSARQRCQGGREVDRALVPSLGLSARPARTSRLHPYGFRWILYRPLENRREALASNLPGLPRENFPGQPPSTPLGAPQRSIPRFPSRERPRCPSDRR